MSDSKCIYDSRELAQVSGIDHNTIINDIEHIIDSLPDEANQFMCFTFFDYLFKPAKCYIMTQKGYDLLQDYWTNQETLDTTSTIYATDKAGNKLIAWTNFKSKLLEPESHIEQIKNNYIEGDNTMSNEAYKSLATASATTLTPSRIEIIEPRCKELLNLWYKKSKTSIYTAVNTKFGELLKNDPLTQKIVQSLQTIRVLWGTEYPGEDDERQRQYRLGGGFYFEQWMKNYEQYIKDLKGNKPIGEIYGFSFLTYTNTTSKLLEVLKDKENQLCEDLETKYDEILTQIKAADTYEQEIQILKAYGVLDYNGVISPAEADELKVPLTLEE